MAATYDKPRSDDPLRLDRCPDCGYLFYQAQGEGVCSECGWRWDRDTIVLYGTGAGPWRNSMTWAGCAGHWPGFLVTGVLFAALVLSLVFDMSVIFSLVFFAACVSAVAWFSFRMNRALHDVSFTQQLRLLPKGFAQRCGFGPARLNRWTRPVRTYICERGITCHCCIYPGTPAVVLAGGVADIEVPLDAAKLEALRQRLRAWRVLALPEQAERFWEEYDNRRRLEEQSMGT